MKSPVKFKVLYSIAERDKLGLCCCAKCIGRVLDLTDPAIYQNLERYIAQDLIRTEPQDPRFDHGNKKFYLTIQGRRRLTYFKSLYSPALGIRSK